MEERQVNHQCYEFDGFRLDASRRVIEATADGRRLALEPRVFDTALYFVQHAGTVLAKERLLADLWPHLVVEENNLTQAVSALRRALGETRGENRFIATVPRRGYCFVAEVHPVRDAVVARASRPCSVSVPAFAVCSTLHDDHHLALGIAACIRHRLTLLPRVRVVPLPAPAGNERDGAERWAASRSRLAPRYLVEGLLQRAGPRVRISTHIVHAANGTYLWSLQSDRSRDAFVLENQIARRVAGALRSMCGA
jgi:DNA-binding winged helix-turn-helix (wHTH) protein